MFCFFRKKVYIQVIDSKLKTKLFYKVNLGQSNPSSIDFDVEQKVMMEKQMHNIF